MAASSRTLVIASAAFASGVAGTIAFTLPRPGEPAPASRAIGPQARAEAPAAAREWSEPTRPPAPSSISVGKPSERLAFHQDDAPGAAADRLDTKGGGPAPRAERNPASRGRPAGPGETDGSRADIGPTMDRPGRAAAIPARPRPRTSVAETVVPQEAQAGRPSPAIVRQARMPVPPRQRVADSRSADERPQPLVLGRSRLPDGPAGEPRRRLSSADASGVMKWLAEPAGRN